MSLKVPDAGELTLLGYLRAQLSGFAVLRLYVNDKVPADADVTGSYTEASFPGYAPQTLSGFTPPATVSGAGQTQANAVTWTVNGPTGQQVYGYFVTDNVGNLLWAERDPSAPIPMNATGNSYTVTARLSLSTQF